MICETKSGYVSAFNIYTVKDFDPNPDADEDEITQGHTFNIIVTGMMNMCVFFKIKVILYSQITITQAQYCSNRTNATGTVKLNRKQIPQALKNIKLKKGEAIFRQRNNLVALK
jgi:hypothetical protein